MKAILVNNSVSSIDVKLVVLIFFLVTPGLSVLSASAENPWHEDSKPLIDDLQQAPTEQNSWSPSVDVLTEDTIDESKFPPFDEDTTLGTNLPVAPREGTTTQYAKPPTATSSTFNSPVPQSFGQRPIYPDSYPGGAYGYGSSPYQAYRPGYRHGYLPGYQSGYQRGYWPGYGNNMGGFPFGGDSNYGFPFGRNNSWMPFTGSGFW